MTRIIWIDFLKGILLILICIGHFGNRPEWIKPIIQPTAMFYVPFFFILSGYLVRTKVSIKKYCYRRIRTLIIPYLFFSLFFIFFDWNLYLDASFVNRSIYRVIVEGLSAEKSTPLWFVVVLFSSSIMSYTLLKYKRAALLLGGAVLLSICAFIFSECELHLPWLLHLTPSATVFIISGYGIKLIIEHRLRYVKFLALMVASVVCIMGTSNLGDMHFNIINQYPLFFIKPIMAAYIIIFVTSLSERYLTKTVSSFPCYIAKNGIVVLAFHCYIIIVLNAAARLFFVSLDSTLLFGMQLALLFGIIYSICIPFCNHYLYVVLGKDKVEWSSNKVL